MFFSLNEFDVGPVAQEFDYKYDDMFDDEFRTAVDDVSGKLLNPEEVA